MGDGGATDTRREGQSSTAGRPRKSAMACSTDDRAVPGWVTTPFRSVPSAMTSPLDGSILSNICSSDKGWGGREEMPVW